MYKEKESMLKIKASYHQERLWFIDIFETGNIYETSPVYHNIPLILEIKGTPDIHVLEQSLREVIRRHESLRTRMITVEDRLFQQVEPEPDFKFQVVDLPGEEEPGTKNKEPLKLAIDKSRYPFSITGEPLIRAELIRFSPGRSFLVITIHHIIADWFSLKIIYRELVLNYQGLSEGVSPRLPEVPLHYADFSNWQREIPEDALESMLFYWKRQLDRLKPLELPVDKPRAPIHIYREGRVLFELSSELSIRIREFCRQKNTGNDVLLLAAFKVLLNRYCGQEDIVVGTGVENRHQPGTEDILGPVANLLVLRSSISKRSSFLTFFSDLNQTLEEAYEYRDISFDWLAGQLNPEKNMSRTVFFDVLFRYDEEPAGEMSAGSLEFNYIETNLGWGKYDLNLLIQNTGKNFTGILVYNAGYFKDSTASRFVRYYKLMLERILEDPYRQISNLSLLTPQEKQQLLIDWNQTGVNYPKHITIKEIFEKQAASAPDHTALVGRITNPKFQITNKEKPFGPILNAFGGNVSITYNELNQRSDRLARLLRERGVLADSIVAIMMDRSIDMIIGIIGILKAGGAYLPIDPDYPHDRIEYMLKDSNALLLLTGLELLDVCKGTACCAPTASPATCNLHLSLAYIIYTSGTTGRPKGVMVEHRNVVRLFFNDGFQFDFNGSDIWTMFHSHCFDFSVWEIFGALLYGGKLIVIPKMVARDTEQYVSLVKRRGVTVLNQTPSAFYRFIDVESSCEKRDLHLRYVIFGGEALNPGRLKRWKERYAETRLINMYGITETTVHVTYKEISREEIDLNIGNIGRPIPTLASYIMDENRMLVPVGGYGELYVGGAGVSRGYLNKPELTGERFIENPYIAGETIYRSGDLVRMLGDGEMVYSGRIDQQVQLRGFRVEPGEIQDRLLKITGISNAVVVDKEDVSGDLYLCAYIVADEAVKPAEARRLLGQVLPDYMVPAYVIKINKIPLTANNKVDREALPEPGFEKGEGEGAVPLDALQEKLAEIWADILNIEKENVGINTNFFDMGGHSLKATILIARIHKEFEVKIPLARVFTTPTIKELSDYIRSTGRERHISIEPVEEREYYPLSSAQKRLYVLHRLASGSTYYNIPFLIELPGTVAEEKLEAAFRNLVARHESLRTSFEMIAEEPVQRINKEFDFSIGRYEVNEVEAGDIIYGFTRPFDLSKAPLLRVNLVTVGASGASGPGTLRRVLFIDMHHIITDATSQDILKREFNALCAGERLPAPRLQYKDYSQWQNAREQGEAFKEQQSFWLKEFLQGDELPVSSLPTDYPRPVVQSFEGNLVNFAFDAEETKIVKTIARENDATLFMCFIALFNVLFARLGGREDIILGVPIAARRHADLQDVVGMMLNTLPLRNYPSADKSFRRFLEEVKNRTLDAYENQEYPFENLVDNLPLERDTGRNPLFDVLLVFMNQSDYSGETVEMPEKPPYRHIKRTSRFDMSFVAMDMGRNIYFSLEYSTNLFTPATIERYIAYLKNIVRFLGTSTGQRTADIEYITGREKQAILELSWGVREAAGMDLTVHGMFEEKAAQVPDRIALVFEDRHVGYGELNRRANRLARLLGEKGAGPGTVVGVMVERSLEMVAAILAVLKAGGAYMPIDPAYPLERILTMLEDSGVFLLLTGRNLLDRFSIMALKNMKPGAEKLTITPTRPQIKDFDSLPLPDRTLIDYRKYHRYIGEAPAKNTITLQATRGCPYRCLFCHKIWPKTHVARSAENVFREISYACDAGIRRFVFIDDIFNLHRKNAERLLETIIKSRMDIQLFFPNGFRADILSRDFIDLMTAAGTVNLAVALESASPRIQRVIEKDLNLEKFAENVRYITEKYPHVILEMEMMHGFPTETEEEALMTLDFLKKLKWVHFPNLHILKIYPNTDMCRFAIENGISQERIERSADLAFHELPDTLPFAKSFTRRFQARFMGEYFLSKERLLHVLPYQTKILTEDELVQKYDSYLSSKIESFGDIIRYAGIAGEELGEIELKQEEHGAPDFCRKIGKYFPINHPAKDAFRILLLDLSLLFSEEHEHMMHHQIEEPLGLLYLMSYLNEKFKERINGKVFKSRIDFDGYDELKKIIFDFNPDLIGIRTLSFYKEFFHKAVLMIRHWGIKAPIAAGGPYATSDFPLVLRDVNVDLVVLGEGEFTLTQLVEKMMENGKTLPGREILLEIPGIAFTGGMGKTPGKEGTREILLMDELAAAHLEKYPGQNLHRTGQPGDLLYVIYTSGSTGKPKGVGLEHRNLINLIRFQYKYTDIDFTRVLQFTNIGFDVSAQEIFSTLGAGGSLVLIPQETVGDIPALFRVVEKENLKTLFLPASFLKFVINEEDFIKHVPGQLAHIVTAGEQLVVNEKLRKYLRENHVYLHNHYGPAEAHVVTALTLEPGENIPGLPSIGRPVSNTAIYILDKGMRLVPLGVAGELVIGGIQPGRGYLNRPEFTAEKFVDYRSYRSYKSYSLYFSKKIYKTGDLARWLADGNIEFLGRMDFQVKIRGFRVELGEIETRLLNHGEIKECVVLARSGEKGGNYLCAYIVSDREFAPSELRDYLSKGLPDYMVPSYFVFLDKIPLTPNRKVDRGALPAPGSGTGKDYAAPRSENEKKLAAIWSHVLNIDINNIGIEDNFFELGGHSLLATILAARIHKEFQVKLALVEVFQAPTIKGLSRHLQGAKEDKFIAIEPVEKKEYYMLSTAQKRLYILQQMDVKNTAYNMPEVIPFAEAPGAGKLENCFNRLIARHESLRTSFFMVDDRPVQQVHGRVEFEIEAKEIVRDGELLTDFIRPFDLFRAPLLRAGLLRLERGRGLLLLDMHHIVCDGISREVLRNDFMLFYEGSTLPPLRIQYKDFSEWQHSDRVRENIKQQEAYWLKQFEGEIPLTDLPTDYARPVVKSFAGGTVQFEIPARQTRILKAIALESGSTLYMILLGAFDILLAKLGSREDIVVGTPVGGRRHADLNKIMGMFVNTLALRNHAAGGKTIAEFLHEVKERTLNAFENQDYPFEELVEKVAVNRDTGRNPLFDTTFALSTITRASPAVTPLETSRQNSETPARVQYDYENKTAKFDLTLVGMERGEELFFSFNYCTKLFKKGTIQRFIAYFKKIVSFIINEPGTKLCRVEIISGKEKEQLLEDFNRTNAEYPADKTLHRLFVEQATKRPDNVALVGSRKYEVGGEKEEQTTLTYGELNQKSDQVAHHLRREGVQPDTIVGIMIERSIEMVIGLLGILKAGGAYLPIDPEYPEERRRYMLTDSGAKILLTNLPEGRYIHHSSIITHHSGNLAYVIYTSGSTGRPKGVLIHHQGVVNMVWSHRRVFKEHAGSTISQVASPAFDAMAFEVWPCFLAGAGLCIADDETRMQPRRLKEWLIRHQVTISFQPTSIALELLDEPWLQSGTALKALRTAGDRLTRYPACNYPFRFYNLYGPTESTVWTTWTEVKAKTGPGTDRYPPIGKPINNHRVYILSSDLELQPIGVPGELCIAGAGLARGYLNRPELTAEMFLPGNYRSYRSYRTYSCYKTGDLARWLSDGNIEFLGRIDHQVKIRGYRIELGEIESQLKKHEKIKEAIVIDRENETGEKYLFAYIIPVPRSSQSSSSTTSLKTPGLKDFLSHSLPDYMIPTYFIEIDKIPLTQNGKIDRKALPALEIGAAAGNYVPPRDRVEKKLVDIWAQILGIEKDIIGINTDFFELGGHSIKAAMVASRIQKEFNIIVPLVELFRTPFIKSLAERIRVGVSGAELRSPKDDTPVLLKPATARTGSAPGTNNLFLIHDGTGEVEGYLEFCKHLGDDINYWGLRADRLENLAPRNQTIEEMARNYIEEIKRIQPGSPYYIAGWSFGGTVAFEIVKQLEQQKENTGFLGLIDSPPPHKDAGNKAGEFNLESELNFVRDYSTGSEMKEKLENVNELSQLWLLAADYLEANHYDVEIIKKAITHYGMQALPDCQRLNIRESIYYLNVGRTFRHAWMDYTPQGSIHTPVYYFAAAQSKEIIKERWSDYCSQPIRFYEISGDHFSIFRMPEVEAFAKLFGKIMPGSSGVDI